MQDNTAATERDDPHDDVTEWLGSLPKESADSPERPPECSSRGRQQPDIQRKELPLAQER